MTRIWQRKPGSVNGERATEKQKACVVISKVESGVKHEN